MMIESETLFQFYVGVFDHPVIRATSVKDRRRSMMIDATSVEGKALIEKGLVYTITQEAEDMRVAYGRYPYLYEMVNETNIDKIDDITAIALDEGGALFHPFRKATLDDISRALRVESV